MAVASAALVLASHRDSRVARHLVRLVPASAEPRWTGVSEADLRHSALDWSARGLLVRRASLAVLGAAPVLVFTGSPVIALGAAYGGFVAPALLVEARARRRRSDADAAIGPLLERVEALAAAGRPAELAFASIAARPGGSGLLDQALRTATASYALGAPLFISLADAARDHGIPRLQRLADELERSRDLGHGSLNVLVQARDAARAAERTRSLAAGAAVESRLMLVLVLCYLPALVLAVIVPLFLGLLEGLVG